MVRKRKALTFSSRTTKKRRQSAAAAAAAPATSDHSSAEESDVEQHSDADADADETEQHSEVESDTTVSSASGRSPRTRRATRPSSPAYSPSSSSSSVPTTATTATAAWQNTTAFTTANAQYFKAVLPIFRQGDLQAYAAQPAKMPQELDQLTFSQWLQYSLSQPDFKPNNMYTDQQYIDLLHQCCTSQTVSTQMEDRTEKEQQWVYNQLKTGTFKRVDMAHRVSADRVDTGPVLITFVEPKGNSTEAFIRRDPKSRDELTFGMMRRCIPASQMEAAIELGHRGPQGVGHVGMDNTFINCSRMFDGVPRKYVREYVKRCAICQIKQPKKYKEPLHTLKSKSMWDRVIMDLVDYGPKKISRGMRYMWHAQDHFSKYNFAGGMAGKSAPDVRPHVEAMLMHTGQIKVLQCDNGGEFMGCINELCDDWGIERPRKSSPFTPQTNGLVERSGGTLKRALDKWMEQEGTNEWMDGLARIVHQVNCTVSTATRRTPYEVIYSWKPRWDSNPIPRRLDPTTMLACAEADLDEAAAANSDLPEPSPPTETAAATLIDIRERSGSASEPDSGDEYFRHTPQVLQRTPEVSGRTLEVLPRVSQPLVPLSADEVIEDAVAVARHLAYTGDSFGSMDPSLNMLVCSDPTRGHEMPPEIEPEDEFTAYGDEYGYLDDSAIQDVAPQHHGSITPWMGDVLNSGPFMFFRRGTYGSGRCLLSAWLGAAVADRGECGQPEKDAKYQCDMLRRSLGIWMLGLSEKGRAELSTVLHHVGNSGATLLQRRGQEARTPEACWWALLDHLNDYKEDLGWDALAALSRFHKVNVLLFVQLTETSTYHARSRRAQQLWREAKEAGEEEERAAMRQNDVNTPGGQWVESTCTGTHVLVPRGLNPTWPFRVLFQRAQVDHHTGANNLSRSSGGLGHFETLIVRQTQLPDDEEPPNTQWNGLFGVNDHEWPHLHTIATRYMAEQYNDLARVRMMEARDKETELADFRVLNAVGLRMATIGQNKKQNSKKGKGTDSLPCIIIAVKAAAASKSSSTDSPTTLSISHQKYTLLCEFGLLEKDYRQDQLVPITLNNFPQLVSIYATFSAGQLCAPTSQDYVPIRPVDYPLVSAEAAWRQELKKTPPTQKKQGRRRDAPERPAAVAADTAIVNAQVDRNRAPDLFALTSVPALTIAPRPSGLRTITVLDHRKNMSEFQVEYGAPSDMIKWERRSLFRKHPEYHEQLVAYCVKHKLTLPE